ncbi:hypothetical protein ACJX0J_040249, partial [Zea mays]
MLFILCINYNHMYILWAYQTNNRLRDAYDDGAIKLAIFDLTHGYEGNIIWRLSKKKYVPEKKKEKKMSFMQMDRLAWEGDLLMELRREYKLNKLNFHSVFSLWIIRREHLQYLYKCHIYLYFCISSEDNVNCLYIT